MKYLCLCYYDPNLVSTLSASESQELGAAGKPHYEAWEKSGKLAAMGGLSFPQDWKTIRPTDTSDNPESKPLVAEGPYHPSGHRVGAFFFVEALDINEAVEIAAKHPSAHTGRYLGGGIEVCACQGFEFVKPT